MITFSPRLNMLFGLFIGLLVGMNLLGSKIIEVFGIAVSVGIFMVPLTFLITDIVEEVYGKAIVKYFIICGVTVLCITFLFINLFLVLEPHERYTSNPEYTLIFSQSLRITIASIIAFLLSQTHDMIVFEWWRKKTKNKALWLRNNFSTWISQLIDTVIFMMIAFYQITPKYTFMFIISLSVPYYLFKIIMALIDTPFVYMGVHWLKKGKKKNIPIMD